MDCNPAGCFGAYYYCFRGFLSPGSAPAKGSAAKRFAALSHSPATSAMAAGAMSFGVKSKTLIG